MFCSKIRQRQNNTNTHIHDLPGLSGRFKLDLWPKPRRQITKRYNKGKHKVKVKIFFFIPGRIIYWGPEWIDTCLGPENR